MGMDIVGAQPRTAAGQHFRNSVWWWRPLWHYCQQTAPETVGSIAGATNDGESLNEAAALALAEKLRDSVATGQAESYRQTFYKKKAELPLLPCDLCEGTGVRRDGVGTAQQLPDKTLSLELSILLGRKSGWCDVCNGEGKKDHPSLNYQFSVENVAAFARFLEKSGGCSIW